MKIIKILGVIIVLIVVVFVLMGVFGPSEIRVERSVTINAPKAVVYEQVSTLENMNKWSPWTEKDPNMTSSIEGTDGTVGAIHKWEGNDEVGKGSQEIISIDENRIGTKLVFIKPFESEADAYIELEEGEGGVTVTWGFMTIPGFLFKAMSSVMNMDASLGPEYEKGLNTLKEMSEKMAAEMKESAYEVVEMDKPTQLFLSKTDSLNIPEIKGFFEEHLPAMVGKIEGSEDITMTGMPCGLYHMWDMENGRTHMSAAIPVEVANEATVDGYEVMEIPAGKSIMVAYYGPYEESMKAHQALEAYMKEKGMEMNGPAIEEYVTDPESEPDPSKWLTNIYYMVQ